MVEQTENKTYYNFYMHNIVYTGCMIANHANQVILDNLVKQGGAFDVSSAYQAMKEQASPLWYAKSCPCIVSDTVQAMNPDLPYASRAGLKEYITVGYCPSDVVGSSVSLTLAYAYDDWWVVIHTSSLETLLPQGCQWNG